MKWPAMTELFTRINPHSLPVRKRTNKEKKTDINISNKFEKWKKNSDWKPINLIELLLII